MDDELNEEEVEEERIGIMIEEDVKEMGIKDELGNRNEEGIGNKM